jgi:hypothetical protein
MSSAGGVSPGSQGGYESDARVPDLQYVDGVATLGVDKVFICTGLTTSEFVAQNFDWQLHRDIITALHEFAVEQGVDIPPGKQADLIHLLYEDFASSRTIEPGAVYRALRLVA